MTRAAQINSDLWLREMMINPKSNPQFENFYKEELIRFCKIAKQEINKLLEDKEKAKDYIKKYDIFKEFSFPLMKRDEENQVKSSIDYQFKNDLYRNLLILLGDKE